ncbi:MAG TPA: hypothetical protein VHA73_16860 [Acidimicrobiales bacterium]|jgi:hypothetical protein|nr:hypothetical protein [Acidimicrobiales bacterium]
MVVMVVLIAVAVVGVVVVGLVVVGGETARLSHVARPAVFDLEEAVGFIAERLPDDVAGRLTEDDVRWVLRADADTLEEATTDAELVELGPEYLDEDAALARVLVASDEDERSLRDDDLAVVLTCRTEYLRAIGAIGARADASG